MFSANRENIPKSYKIHSNLVGNGLSMDLVIYLLAKTRALEINIHLASITRYLSTQFLTATVKRISLNTAHIEKLYPSLSKDE